MVYFCLFLILVGYVMCLPLCLLLIRFSPRLGLLDHAGAERHKLDPRRVPDTGGMAIFWSLVLPILGGLLAIWLVPDSFWSELEIGPAVLAHLPGLRRVTPIGGGIVLALAITHMLGIVDDRHPLSPYVKLLVQFAVAAFLVVACDIEVLSFAGAWVSITVSVLWLVAVMNAFNFLDNMDGLSGGVAAVIAGVYLLATLIGGQWFVAALSAVLLGALMGFLAVNLPPAKLFMGDGGSLVVGLLIGVISVRTTYFDPLDTMPGGVGAAVSSMDPRLDPTAPASPALGRWYGVLMPLLVLAIPLYDLASVTLIRSLRGQNPMRGDHNHFSHRLVKMGLSRRRAVFLVWLATAATGLTGITLGSLAPWQAIIAVTQVVLILTALALVERGVVRAREEAMHP